MNVIMRSSLVLFLFSLLAALPASAQSQMEMNQDARKNFEQADVELNKVYKELTAKLDEESLAIIKKSQKAWVAHRDAGAEFFADLDARGGSMYPMIYNGRRAGITKKRVAELKAIMEEYFSSKER